MENNKKQIEFYKNRIIARIDSIREYISDVKYRLYISMVNECDNYEDIKQLSELDLQIDMFKYIKDLKDKLDYYDTELDELNAVCDKTQRASQMIIISHSKKKKTTDTGLNLSREDIAELMEDNEATTAMAMMIAMQLQNQPINETYREELLNPENEEDDESVSIYEVDKLNLDSLVDMEDDEDEEDDELEIEGLDDLEYEDDEDSEEEDFEIEGLDDLDYDNEEEESGGDDSLDDDILGEIFAEEEKESLKDMKPDFFDEDETEDEEVIDLDSNNDIFADDSIDIDSMIDSEEDEEELDSDGSEDDIDIGDIFADDDEESEEDEETDDIDIDGLIWDDDDEEEESDSEDDIDIDALMEDEEDTDSEDDDIFADDEEDNIDIDSMLDDEDDEDEESDSEEESDDIDIDSMLDEEDDEDENSEDNEEEDSDDFGIDIDALVGDDEDEDEEESNELDIDLDSGLEDIFDIDEDEFLGSATEVDVNELDRDINNMFGSGGSTSSGTSNQRVIPVNQREMTSQKAFLNGTDRGKKTQDMFSALDKLFTRTSKVTKSAAKNVRRHVSNSDMYSLRSQGREGQVSRNVQNTRSQNNTTH